MHCFAPEPYFAIMPKRKPVAVDFALALLDQEGVGRVSALRLLERFPTYKGLLGFPREQVLLRLKGIPNAERTVGLLFEVGAFEAAIEKARDELAEFAGKHIQVIANGHPHWPSGLANLERPNRPVVLYAFGSTEALTRTAVAFHGRPPLPGDAFEAAQSLARRLIEEGIPAACGAQSGFDVVLHKLYSAAGSACVMVARCGLAKVDNNMRPGVAAAVKAGGVLVSPFPPTHGPFDHDDAERVLLQTALAGPTVFVAPNVHTPEAHALEWALNSNRPVFGLVGDDTENALSFPERVHLLSREVDHDWVVAAARTSASP